jgi:hypothetical protein
MRTGVELSKALCCCASVSITWTGKGLGGLDLEIRGSQGIATAAGASATLWPCTRRFGWIHLCGEVHAMLSHTDTQLPLLSLRVLSSVGMRLLASCCVFVTEVLRLELQHQ